MKFNIGDIVKIKTFSGVIGANSTSSDVSYEFTKKMLSFCGVETKIKDIHPYYKNTYILEEYGNDWLFHESWLEHKLVPTKVKIKDLI